jgi:hypothetical protein
LDRQIASLGEEKKTLSDETQKTIAAKNRRVTILIVLLGVAIIAAVLGFVRRKKRALPG